MNWPPRLSEHPAYNTLERKCRRLMGIIMNERERFAEDGVDVEEESRFANDAYERTYALQERAETDPAAAAELVAEQSRLDPELHDRFARLVGLVERYHPESGALTDWKIYLLRWDLCVGEPRRPMPGDYVSDAGKEWEELEPRWITPVFGIPWEKLASVRQAIWDLKMEEKPANRDMAGWTVFLCGLRHGIRCRQTTGAPAVHPFDDGLPQAARECWNEAVDYAWAEITGRVLDEHAGIFESKAAGRLLLGVTCAVTHQTPDVAAWLRQWELSVSLTRLLAAMGVIAPTDGYGQRLFRSVGGLEPLVSTLQHRPGLADIVRGFESDARASDR